MKKKLFLDDLRTVDMVYAKSKVSDFDVVRCYEGFVKYIELNGLPEFISFDNDLGLDKSKKVAPDGLAAAKWLVYESGLDLSHLEFRVHSANPVAAEQIRGLLSNYINFLNKSNDSSKIVEDDEENINELESLKQSFIEARELLNGKESNVCFFDYFGININDENMNSDNTLQQIIEYKKKTLKIPNSESLDDIKEMESYDYEIVSLIYDHCVSKNYNIDGFPEKYSEFIANDDDDFYDFLSFEVKYYYGLKNALLHKEVLLFFKTYYYYPEAAEYTDEACKEDILLEISLLKDEGVNLDFNKEDY